MITQNSQFEKSSFIFSIYSILLISTLFSQILEATEKEVKSGHSYVLGERALSQWQLTKAIKIVEEIEKFLPETPMTQALKGRIAFHQGQFQEASRLLLLADESNMADKKLLALAIAANEETKDYQEFKSEHFVLRMPKGKDTILKDPALATLEMAYKKLTVLFNFIPDHMIVVDILHDTDGLAAITPLSQKDIETSGTIALCKYNRLMIISPKALARGYSWLETLSHELIHLILSEKTKNSVPIWLHEGTAKYYQSIWNGDPGRGIHAVSEKLLAQALKKKELITFEAMYPSMAKLPSQEATTLAFAEVFTMIEFMQSKKFPIQKTARLKSKSSTVLNLILENLKTGLKLEAAIKKATGFTLKQLQGRWKKYLKNRKFTIVRGQKAKKLQFIKRTQDNNNEDEEGREDLENKDPRIQKALNFVRIADLLRKKSRIKAAIIEYEKAYKLLKTPSLKLIRRLSNMLIQEKKLRRAQTIIEKSIYVFNDDPQLHVSLAFIYEQQENYSKSKEHYQKAIWENPFHPVIYKGLANIAKKEKDLTAQESNQEKLRLLTTK